uniref:class I SAM-dependent methyltransferase n=1 Tax=Tepidiforma sp. TaxID=2682230 RepID=UPI002ADD7EDB
RLRRAGLGTRVVGVEIDRARAERAGAWARPGLEFRHGGFNLPLGEGEAAVVVRAFNVLRQYTPGEVTEALEEVAAGMAPGGMLIEGTCDPWGRLACWWAWERTGSQRLPWGEWPEPPLRRRWLVLGARMPGVLSPRAFQPYLPKELIHEAEPGGVLDGMFAAWEYGWVRAAGAPPRERWHAGLAGLAEAAPLVRWPALERRGLAVVRADAGPLAAVLRGVS